MNDTAAMLAPHSTSHAERGITFKAGRDMRPPLGFVTGVDNALVYTHAMENQGLAVAADGSIWTLTAGSVSQFLHDKGELLKMCDYQLYNPQPLGFPQHLAPVDGRHAFFIQNKNSQPVVMEYRQEPPAGEEKVKALPALDGDMPAAVSAAADGSMWVLGRSGHAWHFAENKKWKKVAAPADTKILQVSVGSASFVLARARKNSRDQILQLKDGQWVADASTLPGGSWIGACEGGQFWWSSASLQTPGDLYLIHENKILQCFPLQKGATGFTAATFRGCYFFSTETMGFQRAALGVIDQPAEKWPTMDTVQTQIYDHISDELGIGSPEGLRSQYTNINSTFSFWHTTISQLIRPAKYPEADWQAVTAQLKKELQCVMAVTTMATNLGLLNAAMGQIYTNTYNQVVQMTGLPEHQEQQPDTPVTIIMPHVLEKLKGAVIDQAKSFIGSEAVGIAVACFDYANDKLAKKHQLPDGKQPLIIACSKLAAAIAQIVVDSEFARGEFQTAILRDWGKLRACGDAINSGVWYWSPKTNYEVLKPLGRAIELNFYQTLMPVKWKVILCETLQHYQFPGKPFMSFVPIYSLMYKMMDDTSRNRIYWWWACLEVGSSVEQMTKGTCPNQQLLERIFSLGTTPLDFFTGNNGWRLPVATVAGYRPPPDGVAWQEYRNYPHPF